MSRLYIKTTNDNTLVLNEPLQYDNTPRLLIVDADSLFYHACYNPARKEVDANGNSTFKLTPEEDLNNCKYNLDNKIQDINNTINNFYNITNTTYFYGGKNNFRYQIYPEYKANRKNIEKPPFINEIIQYFKDNYNPIEAEGCESDDYVYNAYLTSNKQCVVAAIDKDVINQCCEVPIYYYQRRKDEFDFIRGEFINVTEKQSKHFFVFQLITGDVTDNIKGEILRPLPI
jgi:5'-3' exonuclease